MRPSVDPGDTRYGAFVATSRSVATERRPAFGEDDSGETQVAHRRPQLVGREQRHERIAAAVFREFIRLAEDDRRRTGGINRRRYRAL